MFYLFPEFYYFVGGETVVVGYCEYGLSFFFFCFSLLSGRLFIQLTLILLTWSIG